jgi:hypothetical protein
MEKLDDVPGMLLQEIEHFFSIYTELEGKKVSIEGWRDLASAQRVLAEARERFELRSKRPRRHVSSQAEYYDEACRTSQDCSTREENDHE